MTLTLFYSSILLFLSFRLVTTQRLEGNSKKPQFVGILKNVTVPAGRDATFSCNVRNLGPFRVGWVRSDSKAIQAIHSTVITHNTRVTVSGDFKSSFNLNVAKVEESDRGQYMCQINTDPMMYQSATLDVLVPPDIDSERTSEDQEAAIGGSVTLQCYADGYPQPKIKWKRKDSKLIKVRDLNTGGLRTYEEYRGPVLNLPNIQIEDMGEYYCIADNNVPPVVSYRVYIYVLFAPKVRPKEQVKGVVEGRSVVLTCKVAAYPQAMVAWRKDGKIILSNDGFVVNETEVSIYGKISTLKIRRANRSHMGRYSCEASNSVGKSDTTIRLYHIVAPEPEPTYTEPEIIMTEKPVLQMKEDFKEKRRSKQKKPHDRNVERYETISETGEGTGSQSADFQNQLNQNDNSNNMFSHSSAAHLKFSSLLILGQIMYFVALIL